MSIHIDIGGEGRYLDAINVNPFGITSTTGEPGRPIRNLVLAIGEQLPFADGAVDFVTVENAPLRSAIVDEIARVLAPGGSVHLQHPADYALAQGTHDAVRAALGPAGVLHSTSVLPDASAVTLLRRTVDLLR